MQNEASFQANQFARDEADFRGNLPENVDPGLVGIGNPAHYVPAPSSVPIAEEEDDVSGANAGSTRRTTNNPTGAAYGGKGRYLKKADGEPLWRGDIQYRMLRMIFEDDKLVFTNAADGTTGHTFADVYIDAMAKSNKCSQILRDKLLSDRVAAMDMAMICLLVNVGRINTTINFFPEMRAKVRTYHSIPSLQARQGPGAYKQLQDGPRLKSILKGAMEDSNLASTIEDLSARPRPRSNPVNLLFAIVMNSPKVSEPHIGHDMEFWDLFIRPTFSSASRARAFLWIMWWYLESDFSFEDSQNNPYGPGQPLDGQDIPLRVPAFEEITEEDATEENLDTPDELAFGETKRQEREAIVSNDMPPTAAAPKRGNRTPIMEHQHNYRFRVSPFGSQSEGGSSRGGRTPRRPVAENSV